MDILISNSSDKPIYEQITIQIKQMIISGEIEVGYQLPSMRMLAKELRISVITTKRAYEELERDGFIYTVIGKGSYVAEKNMEFVREEQLKVVEDNLRKAVIGARTGGIEIDEMIEILNIIYMEDNYDE
ncbi:MAG: GntR family transcriptional regulator [Clostridiales bacterium]|nr:GntR family transcriptional regulator [Clostridiales bacterium]